MRRNLVRALVLALVLAVLAVAFVAGRVVLTGLQDDRRVSSAIVVLGTAQFDGTPSDIFQSRLRHAQELYDAQVAPRIITVGGSQPGDRFTEAAAGRDFLAGAGVPADDLVAVETGSDTQQSIDAVAALMADNGWEDAVIVTDPWHCLRSRSMARDAGIDAVASPVTDGPTRDLSRAARYVARETVAYLAYELVLRHR